MTQKKRRYVCFYNIVHHTTCSVTHRSIETTLTFIILKLIQSQFSGFAKGKNNSQDSKPPPQPTEETDDPLPSVEEISHKSFVLSFLSLPWIFPSFSSALPSFVFVLRGSVTVLISSLHNKKNNNTRHSTRTRCHCHTQILFPILVICHNSTSFEWRARRAPKLRHPTF